MCQLGWTTVSRHMVKQFSGCFCEGDEILNSQTLIKQIIFHNVGRPHPIS